MKHSQTLTESTGNMKQVTSSGDIRLVIANAILANGRGEIPAETLIAMAKGCDAITNSIAVEIKLHKAILELREQGGKLGKLTHLGQLPINDNGNSE